MTIMLPRSEDTLAALERWNPWWASGSAGATGVRRDVTPTVSRWIEQVRAVAILGMRRAGKSTVMRQVIGDLLDRGVPARDVLLVNFEEPILIQHLASATFLEDLFALYSERVRPGGPPFVFLDEVQNLDHWVPWVRAATELGRARIVLSGSTAHLLEADVGAALTGRVQPVTVWPFSFGELRRARPDPPGPGATAGEAARRSLLAYLEHGGLPEAVLLDDDVLRERYLKTLFRDLLYRDVVSRHEVRDVRPLETVAVHLLENTARPMTFNRLRNLYGIPTDQVRRYSSYLVQCWLVGEVRRLAFKVAQREVAPRKVYATDIGLRNAVTLRFSQDLGWLAETVVFNALRRDDDARVHYFAGRGECDFVVWKGTRAVRAVQVCHGDGPLPARERAGLLEAMEAHGISEGEIVTDRAEGTSEETGRRIRLVPLWRWLLEQEDAAP